jgi:hypothetical protein
MKTSIAGLGALALLGAATGASAVSFPYTCGGAPGSPRGSCGYVATTYTFKAATTGPVDVYFAGASAWYTDKIGMLVNGQPTGIFGLSNQTSTLPTGPTYLNGSMINLGNVVAGDTIVFKLRIYQTGDPSVPGGPVTSYPEGFVYSDPSKNKVYDNGAGPGGAAGNNHIYVVPFAPTGYGPFPHTYFIGWEDQSIPVTDYDYNDQQIVVTNLIATAVPEPASWALMLVGFGGLGAALRLRGRRATASA